MDLLQQIIEKSWNDRTLLGTDQTQNAIRRVIELLDSGEIRVATYTENSWQVNQWIKKAVVMYFIIQKMETSEVGIFEYHDKIPLKKNYAEKGIRIVPNAVARYGSYISDNVILMPAKLCKYRSLYRSRYND